MKDFYEHIDDYVAEKLNRADRAAMDRALREDENLREAVANHEGAMMILDASIEEEIRRVITEDEHRVIEESSRDTSGSEAQKHHEKSKVNWKLICLIGALMLMLLLYFIWKIGQSTQNDMKFAEVYVAPAWPTDRGTKDDISEAISNYNQGDEVLAISQLKSIDNDEAYYWLSELYLEKQAGDSVLYYLPSIELNTGELRRDRMLFIEILAVHLQGNKPQVELLLNQLPRDMDAWYIERLKQLMN